MPGILICDDNPNIRYLLRVFVESQTPFKVCGEASHGTEAIEKARVLQPELILLDLAMPVMSGAEAASVLKAMLPRTKIILFSMHMDNVPRSLAAAIALIFRCRNRMASPNLVNNLKGCLQRIELWLEILILKLSKRIWRSLV